MKLAVATRSEHKLSEIRRILSSVPGLDVLGLEDLGITWTPEEEELEPYDSFGDNALSKARYFQPLTNLPTVADDSGLVVDALDGRPGVRSKRFSPEEGLEGLERDLANNRHLVRLLRDVPREKRTARYVCVAALVEDRGASTDLPDDAVPARFFRGEASGLIVDEARGEGGFGYDPHFLDPELGRTFAEITPEEKNARSHRGNAFRALAGYLASRSSNGDLAGDI